MQQRQKRLKHSRSTVQSRRKSTKPSKSKYLNADQTEKEYQASIDKLLTDTSAFMKRTELQYTLNREKAVKLLLEKVQEVNFELPSSMRAKFA